MLARRLLMIPMVTLTVVVVVAFFVVRNLNVAHRKDQLTLGMIGEPDVLNPILSQSTSSSEVEALIFNSLLGSDENLNVIGELASDYQVTQDSTGFFKTPAAASRAQQELLAAKDAWAAMHLASVRRHAAQLVLHLEDPASKVVAGTSYQEELFKIIDRRDLLPVCVITVSHNPEAQFANGDLADSQELITRLSSLAGSLEGVEIHEVFPINDSLVSVSVYGDCAGYRRAVEEMFRKQSPPGKPVGQIMEYLDEALLNEPTIRFTLRRDVRWQDGQPLTSRDAAFTYHCIIDPKYRSPRAGDYWPIKKVETPDPYTFVVQYRTPYGDLVHSWQKTQLIPAHVLEGKDAQWWADNFNSRPIGTGPFRVEQWKRNEYVRLRANPDYFEGPPNLPAAVFRILPDPFVNQIAFEAKGFDTYTLAPYQVQRYEQQTDRYDLFRDWGLGYVYIGWNLKNPLFADRRVRVALAHAVDVDRIIKYVYRGWARRSNGTFPRRMWYANKDIEPYPYDPDKARELLAEAGWTDSDGDGWLDKDHKRFEFSLITNHGNTMRMLIQQLVQDDLKKIGIKVDTASYEWAVFITNYLNTRQFDACLLGWALYYNYDLYGIWHSSQAEPPGMNNVGYANKQVDRLLEEVRTTFERERIKQLCNRIQELIYRDQPYLFLLEAQPTAALYKDLYVVRRPLPDGQWLVEPIRQTQAGYTFYMKWWAPKSMAPALSP